MNFKNPFFVTLLILTGALHAQQNARDARILLEQVAREKEVARQMAIEEIKSQWSVAKSLSNDGVDEAALQALESLSATLEAAPKSSEVAAINRSTAAELIKIRKRLADRKTKIIKLQGAQAATVIEAERRRARTTQDAQVRVLLGNAQRAYDSRNYKAASKYSERVLALSPGNRQAASMKRLALQESYSDRISRIHHTRTSSRTDILTSAQEASIVPNPGQVMTYPNAARWRQISARRKKYRQSKVKPPEPWEVEIRDSLKLPLSFEFENTPLQDVLAFMQEATHVNIILDRSAVGDANEPITLAVNKMTARAALDWVVRMVDLEYAFMNEAVFVSSKAQIAKFRPKQTHLYDLDEILNLPGGLRAAGMSKQEAAEDWVRFLKKVVEAKTGKPTSTLE
jgi:hypothetical protein